MRRVVGCDVARGLWVAVVLVDGRFEGSFIVRTLDELGPRIPDAAAIALDIPIGLPIEGCGWPRAADLEARDLLGRRRGSVFLAPPRPILECASYDDANRAHRELTGKGLSRQSWGLRRKILEAEAFVGDRTRTVEVHPELSFRAMHGAPLEHSKKTWNGQMARRSLLARCGIVLPDRLDRAGDVPADDLLDAAVAAWTAWRFDRGVAERLPRSGTAPRPTDSGQIWF